jgi:hypothetical protein
VCLHLPPPSSLPCAQLPRLHTSGSRAHASRFSTPVCACYTSHCFSCSFGCHPCARARACTPCKRVNKKERAFGTCIVARGSDACHSTQSGSCPEPDNVAACSHRCTALPFNHAATESCSRTESRHHTVPNCDVCLSLLQYDVLQFDTGAVPPPSYAIIIANPQAAARMALGGGLAPLRRGAAAAVGTARRWSNTASTARRTLGTSARESFFVEEGLGAKKPESKKAFKKETKKAKQQDAKSRIPAWVRRRPSLCPAINGAAPTRGSEDTFPSTSQQPCCTTWQQHLQAQQHVAPQQRQW